MSGGGAFGDRGPPRGAAGHTECSTTSTWARASWPSTSCCPATRIGPRKWPSALTTSSSRSATASSPRPPARTRAGACRACRRGSARTTWRSSSPRSSPSRSTRLSSGSARVACSATTSAWASWSSPAARCASRRQPSISFTRVTRQLPTTRPLRRWSRRQTRLAIALTWASRPRRRASTELREGRFRSCRSAFRTSPRRWRSQGVVNFEMEASALLVLAGLAKCRAGVVCTAYAQRVSGAFVQGAQKEQAESACIDTGLEALRLLAEMDDATRAVGAVHWRPSLWVSQVAS